MTPEVVIIVITILTLYLVGRIYVSVGVLLYNHLPDASKEGTVPQFRIGD